MSCTQCPWWNIMKESTKAIVSVQVETPFLSKQYTCTCMCTNKLIFGAVKSMFSTFSLPKVSNYCDSLDKDEKSPLLSGSSVNVENGAIHEEVKEEKEQPKQKDFQTIRVPKSRQAVREYYRYMYMYNVYTCRCKLLNCIYVLLWVRFNHILWQIYRLGAYRKWLWGFRLPMEVTDYAISDRTRETKPSRFRWPLTRLRKTRW